MIKPASPRPRDTTRIGWFAVVGIAGFVIDSGILTALMRVTTWPVFLARACSFSVAVTVTWLLNRKLAFSGGSRFRPRTEYAGYFVIQIVGAAINLGVFFACLTIVPQLISWPVIPLAVGAVIAFLFNFFITRSTLYAAAPPSPTHQD